MHENSRIRLKLVGLLRLDFYQDKLRELVFGEENGQIKDIPNIFNQVGD